MRIALIVSKFNPEITQRLLNGAYKGLQQHGLSESDYDTFIVPGAFDIPAVAQKLSQSKKYAGLITLGAVIRGETDHYRTVCDGVTYGIQKVSIENVTPILFGVLMCDTMDQARARSEDDESNKGFECAQGLFELLPYFNS
ncbi:6,7-dimethyl-8-ribityllumazine synthase [Candidatus Peregrinibacteria bacterium CG_4_9_14_0_2_um_filter_53_11]|nr:MAG: 6,7-dimethyl-8-ribityllumazine synthase [Candidatus Peregrinibacteria bacterium CG_4_9_14_0_2_um_filter_53_11]